MTSLAVEAVSFRWVRQHRISNQDDYGYPYGYYKIANQDGGLHMETIEQLISDAGFLFPV